MQSEVKHTAGTVTIEHSSGKVTRWDEAKLNIGVEVLAGWLATREGLVGSARRKSADRLMRQARVMLAAPDLLEALKDLVPIARATHGAQDRVAKAEAAIRKAMGGTDAQ